MMPRCLNCGNASRFASSKIASIKQYHEPYGMTGHFSEKGDLLHLEYNNASPEIHSEVWRTPERFFDQCLDCGSTNLLW